MNYQNLINKVGFGPKAYSLLSNRGESTILLTGQAADYNSIVQRIKKNCNLAEHIEIGEKSRSLKGLSNLSDKLLKKNSTQLIVVGGGSIIDLGKRIYLEFKSSNKEFEFYVIPSKVGSGAEASITSIINSEKGKLITVDENFLPHAVIYDTSIISQLDNMDIVFGSLDAMSHCIESMSSINTNPYVNFLSISTIENFRKNLSLERLFNTSKFSSSELIQFCLLSFNGGIAQNNAGAGLCHALSHSAEQLTGVPHSVCIAFFTYPTLRYINEVDKDFLSRFDFDILEYSLSISELLCRDYDFSKLRNLLQESSMLENLIQLASNDVCWKLFYKRIDKVILTNILTS